MKLRTNRRNIGIIAHVDAGKTTVSERILYYCGTIHSTGEVHNGAATLDDDPREKAHGITISSAATTVSWNEHSITLIDTPGHVDFNIEVKRALRVLDGAVVVFDAVAGVEPQTEANWRLADDFQVPRLAFINKMDRRGANFLRTVEMIENRFNAHAVLMQIPVGSGDEFEGILCPFSKRIGVWSKELGDAPAWKSPEEKHLLALNEARASVIEAASLFDDNVLEAWLSGQEISEESLRNAIRVGVLQGRLVPVYCGSALRNIGIEPLLDAVVQYLPTPEETNWNGPSTDKGTVAYAFKVSASEHGSLVYCRVYQGTISEGDRLINSSNGRNERVSGSFAMHAGKKTRLDSAVAGDIVTLAGLKETSTGQTLCSDGLNFSLEELKYPEPVTTISLEATDLAARDKLMSALDRIRREDPTLHVSTDPETGQLLLSGMGELHLAMVRERIEAEIGVPIATGKPQVAFRETITHEAEVKHLRKKQSGGPGQYAGITIKLVPAERGEGFSFESLVTGGAIPQEYLPAIERGVRNRLASGFLCGNPIVDVKVSLLDGETHPNDSSAMAFEFAASEAIELALQQAKPVILEPTMKVEVQTPDTNLGSVIGDLSRRRGIVCNQETTGSGLVIIIAEVPLANLFGYADQLRSLTAGRAGFSMQFSHYSEQ